MRFTINHTYRQTLSRHENHRDPDLPRRHLIRVSQWSRGERSGQTLDPPEVDPQGRSNLTTVQNKQDVFL